MKIIEDFLNFTKDLGLDNDALYREKLKDFEILSFKDKLDDFVIHAVVVFYNDEDSIEIYVRKESCCNDELKLLKSLNEFNQIYCGASFFIDEDKYVNIKSFLTVGGKIEPIVECLKKNIDIVKKEFQNL